jgi:hypothetical protein
MSEPLRSKGFGAVKTVGYSTNEAKDLKDLLEKRISFRFAQPGDYNVSFHFNDNRYIPSKEVR